jgi:hypothetical protein
VIKDKETTTLVQSLVLDTVMLSALMTSNLLEVQPMSRDGTQQLQQESLAHAVLRWIFGKLTRYQKPILFTLAKMLVNIHAVALNVVTVLIATVGSVIKTDAI